LPQRSVYEWIEKLKNGHTSFIHEEGAGCPSTATTYDNIERVRDKVLLDRRLTIYEVTNCLQISHGSSYEFIHNRLGFHKVCARWIPKQLTMLHKQTCLDICQQNLDCYDKEGDAFLDRIITGDKTWVHHYEPECKRQIMEWKHPQSPIRKKIYKPTVSRKIDSYSYSYFGNHKAQYWNIIRRGVQQ